MYRWAISINKERTYMCNLSQKGKSWSSNANDLQIIIIGLPSEQYKLGSSDYKEVWLSHFTTWSNYYLTWASECLQVPHSRSSHSEHTQEESGEEQKKDRHRGFLRSSGSILKQYRSGTVNNVNNFFLKKT